MNNLRALYIYGILILTDPYHWSLPVDCLNRMELGWVIHSPEPDLSQQLLFCNPEVNLSSVAVEISLQNRAFLYNVYAKCGSYRNCSKFGRKFPDQPTSNMKHIYRGGFFSSKRICDLLENLMFVHEVSLHDIKFGVWCAICATRIIGHIFLVRT
jgi:hypothetical protein